MDSPWCLREHVHVLTAGKPSYMSNTRTYNNDILHFRLVKQRRCVRNLAFVIDNENQPSALACDQRTVQTTAAAFSTHHILDRRHELAEKTSNRNILANEYAVQVFALP